MLAVSADTANQTTAAGGGTLARDKRSYREQSNRRKRKSNLRTARRKAGTDHRSGMDAAASCPPAQRRPRRTATPRHPGRARPGSGFVGLLAAAAAVLALAAPAQGADLVSNLGQSGAGNATANVVAQGFRTGDQLGGYRLDAVRMRGGARARTVSVWTTDAMGRPATEVAALTYSGYRIDGHSVRYTAPEDTYLEPETKYAIRVYAFGAQGVALARTPSDAEDEGAADGWRIANRYWRLDGSDWSTDPQDRALMIAVEGRDRIEIWSATMTVGSATQTVVDGAVTSTGFSTLSPATGQLSEVDFEAESNAQTEGLGEAGSYSVTSLEHQTVTGSDGAVSSSLYFAYTYPNLSRIAGSMYPAGLALQLRSADSGGYLTYWLPRRGVPKVNYTWPLRNVPPNQLPGGAGVGDTLTVRLIKAPPLQASLELVREDEGPNDAPEWQVDLRLNTPIWIPSADMRRLAFTVDDGTIARAKRLRKSRVLVDGTRRAVSDHWRLWVRSDADSSDATVLTLPDHRRCSVRGALCTLSGGRLEDGPSITLGAGEDTSEVELSVADATANEGLALTFVVTASRPLKRHAFAEVRITGGTATSGADYLEWGNGGEGTVQLEAGRTSTSFRVFTKSDSVNENDETVNVELDGAWIIEGIEEDTGDYIKGRSVSIADSRATGTIKNVAASGSRSSRAPIGGAAAAKDGRSTFSGPAAVGGDGAPAAAQVDGAALTLAWPSPRDAFGTPSGSDWAVAVNGAPRAVAAARVAGRRVVLTLSAPVAATDAVTVGYAGSAMHPLADASGAARSAPWDGVVAENRTGMPAAEPNRPDDAAGGAAWWPGAQPAHTARLDASGFGLSGLAALRRFVALERLDLSDNALADLHGIEAHAALRELDLSGNRIADLGPLRALAGLERLDLSGNRVADLAPLAALPALKVLVLDGNRVADLGPLTHLAALEHLALADNAVADLAPLQDLARLRRLDLGGNPVADLSPLGDVASLEWLALPDDATAADALARLPVLRRALPAAAGRESR